jgi:ADP-heptose:LPS heptosyltransferase
MGDWKHCKNILCIRADNMGDLIMTTPALRALKESFGCRITVLTSRAGSVITNHLNVVDEVIIHDLPWVKSIAPDPSELLTLTEQIRKKDFDAAIIFTVYSQSALPAAMMV